jgi:hypothetical protein
MQCYPLLFDFYQVRAAWGYRKMNLGLDREISLTASHLSCLLKISTLTRLFKVNTPHLRKSLPAVSAQAARTRKLSKPDESMKEI